MSNRYYSNIAEARSKYPYFEQSLSNKKQEVNGRIYTKIGTAYKDHSILWQMASVIKAVALTALGILIIPICFSSYRKWVATLWNQAVSGTEKLALYVIDAPAEAHVEEVLPYDLARKLEEESNQQAVGRALKLVRENVDNFQNLPLEMRDNEAVVLAAIDKSHFPIMQHASVRMQGTRNVGLAAVMKAGGNFQHLQYNLRNDKIVALAAMKDNFNAFDFASERLQRDPEVIEARRRSKAEIDELRARFGGPITVPTYPQKAAPVEKKPWVCPAELENDPTENGAFIRKVLKEAADSQLDFTATTTPADKAAYRTVLCKMLSIPESSADGFIKTIYGLQIGHVKPNKKQKDQYAQEAYRYLQKAYDVVFEKP